MSNLDHFYQEVLTTIDKENHISAESKSVVLFRAAIETGASELGIKKVVFIMSKLMTSTLGVMDEDEEDSENTLNDNNIEGMTLH
jgi:hypothetical protein